MSRGPFKITGPTCISFSGGRSSAYMLWLIIQQNGGLPDGSHVIFANTGKEREESLEFVVECSEHWGVPIHWVEYVQGGSFRRVDFDSALRNGEPFNALIADKGNYLPNPVERFCTVELKIKPAIALMREFGHAEHDNFVGMRADEPTRVAKVRANPSGGAEGVDRRVPLADAGIGKHQVKAFWNAQPFDLRTDDSNCDLCFNKPPFRKLSVIKEEPRRAVWWISKEKQCGATFTKNEPSIAQLAEFARDQRDMFDQNEEAIPCFCGD